MLVPIYINGRIMNAVVDTASQITLIGENLATDLGLAPDGDSTIRIQGVGTDMEMMAKVVRNVNLRLGSQNYSWDLIVGPARELCILGLDFLHHVGAIINLRAPCIEIGGVMIAAEIRANLRSDPSTNITVSAISSQEVPPFAGRVVQCRLSSIMTTDFLVESLQVKKELIIPEILMKSGSETELHIFNISDKPVIIYENVPMAVASPVDLVMSYQALATADSSITELCGSPDESLRIPSHTDNEADNMPAVVKDSAAVPKSTYNDEELPEHLQHLYTSSAIGLSENESLELKQLLIEFQDIFAKHDFDLGEFTELMHKIDTGEAAPIKCGLRRTPLGFQSQEEAHLQMMLEAGIIQPSSSDWAAAPVIVRKKCGSYRYCLDYRGLNSVTRKDNFPLPLIEECLDTLADNHYFSTLDMASGYWQILIDPHDRHKTAFLTKYGLFEHVRLAMGLCNSPATYQRAMTLVLRDILWKDVLAYLDDLIILGKDFSSHLKNLREVFQRFRFYHLKFKPKKCTLFGTEVDFLGRRVSREGVSIPESKVNTVKEWPVPKGKTELEAFLGFINYHRDFIPHLAEEASILYDLVKTSSNQTAIDWTPCHDDAFRHLKESMLTAPVLGYPKPEDLFILDTDASNHSIGAELSQIQDGKEVVIAYASMSLNAQQRKYCTTRKELLALVTFLHHFRFYLLGRSFIVRTDHNSLTWLMRFRNIEGQLARWIESISQFNFQIQHRAGKLHGNADGLSRIQPDCDCYNAGSDISSLPCGGCNFCLKKHQQWERFDKFVDDVVPLAMCRLNVTDQGNEEGEGTKIESEINWAEEQTKDPEIQVIRQWLKYQIEPLPDVLFLQSNTTKRLWQLRSRLALEDDILYYSWINATDQSSRSLIIVPQHLRHHVLQLAHDVKPKGHPGHMRTKLMVLHRFFWPGVTSHVRDYVASCKTCNTLKKGNKLRKAGLRIHHSGFPMERIHIDILGPFHESTRGHRYVLVMIDQFTKWIELAPLAEQTAEDVAKVLVEQFICRMGCAHIIFSDQGRNFESSLFKEICSMLEMAKLRTTPYRPSSNGQVERMNREILFKIRAYLDNRQRDWDVYLPIIGMALRATRNESTGYSPNMMMLGREVDLPLDMLVGPQTDQEANQSASSRSYVHDLQTRLHDTHAVARERLHDTLQQRKRLYDRKQHSSTFGVDDFVYLMNNANKKGHSKKLQPIYIGPFLIVEKISDILYTIEGFKGRSRQVVHHDRLRLCNDRDIPLWAQRHRRQQQTIDSSVPDESMNLSNLYDDWSNHDASDGDPPGDSSSPLDGSVPDVSADQSVSYFDPFQAPGPLGQDVSNPPMATQHQRPRRNRQPPSWLRDHVTY